jgi:hypothetical protein
LLTAGKSLFAVTNRLHTGGGGALFQATLILAGALVPLALPATTV